MDAILNGMLLGFLFGLLLYPSWKLCGKWSDSLCGIKKKYGRRN
jgi:hypothetical protein